jgi:Protein of unknown function (DUF1553)/Protein of unknown function (DUF1549)/Planctomycete cytochrome C
MDVVLFRKNSMAFLSQRWTLMVVALIIGVVCLANLFTTVNDTEKPLPKVVDFNWHIRPILSDRCFACHGPDEGKRKANLRFDTREGAFSPVDTLNGVPRFAILPGNPEQSLLVQRICSGSQDSIMPPLDSHLSLTPYEKQLLIRWIEQGAPWKNHWAFTAPERPKVPEGAKNGWNKNPIDAFILEKMTENDLAPSKEMDKARLLRRASFALTGLPPTPAQLQQFLQNYAPDAYDKVVDDLLNTAAYGERWTMYWLDLARYADTHGYQDDLPRTMWPWRDWVINAFNKNMPYDQFVTWQLAGDLLPDKSKETLLASAFNRNHKISQEGGVIEEEYRVEYVADRTNTFGKAFLGLTLECARCHDHKYDPISTREYYSAFAFFNNLDERGFVPNLETPKPYMVISAADYDGSLPFLNKHSGLKKPQDTILQMVMHDSIGLRNTYRLVRGKYDQPGEMVTPTLPAAILPFDTSVFQKNRLGMSQWLFSPANPLTARVWVNRLWQEVFGRGIVQTSENFGVQGALPSHPELLDWLAVEFRESGWDIKHILRLMVTSATFKQSGVANQDRLAKDPENNWLSRGPRVRMPYEFLRDNILSSSGLLVQELGGPSVKPWQPPGIWEEISTEKTANASRGEYSYVPDTLPEKKYRRSLYTYQRRTIPPPTHLTFDAPMRDNCEVRRTRSNTPLQALVLLHDKQVLEAADALATLLLQDPQLTNPTDLLNAAFQRIMTRAPDPTEMKLLVQYFENERARPDPETLQKPPVSTQKNTTLKDQNALMLTITVIYNMDEAIVM